MVKPKLSLPEQLFVAAITDKDNPKTFNNGKQSYLSVKPHVSPDAATVQASRMLSRDNVQGAIQAIIEDIGCNLQDRVRTLASIYRGSESRKTTIYRKQRRSSNADSECDGSQSYEQEPVNPDELQVDSIIETDATFAERVKAIDILNKLDGTYARADAAKQIAVREYDELARRLRGKLKRASLALSSSPTHEGTEVEGGCL